MTPKIYPLIATLLTLAALAGCGGPPLAQPEATPQSQVATPSAEAVDVAVAQATATVSPTLIATPTPKVKIYPTMTPWTPPTPPAQTPTPLSPPLRVMESQAGCLVYRGKAFQKLCLDENGEVVGPPEDMVFEPPAGFETVKNYFAQFYRLVPSSDGKYITVIAKTGGGEIVDIIDMTTKKATMVYWVNIKGKQANVSGLFYNWHPNGSEFLFREDNAFDKGLWLIEAQTSQHRLLAQPHGLHITGGAISPDGQRLMYAANDPRTHQIWTANVDGSDPQMLVDGGGVAVVWEWSPDGRYVVYKGEPSGGGLWVMDRTGQERKQLQGPYLFGYGFDPMWSFDGKYLAYVGAEQLDPCWEKDDTYRADPLCGFKGPAIYVEDVDTGELRQVATNTIDPAWTPGGAILMSRMDENGQIDIWRVNANGTDLRRLTNTVEVDRYPVWLPQ